MAIDPNMGFLLPTDHGDAETWGVILDNALTVIGAHNHAAGSGAKISISQLAFDADISFVDSGGGKHAITDLKAIDFFPSPATGMAALSGALFLSDGTSGLAANELYYRTTSGANVQVTNGVALNFAAFVGGIGGDYSAVGALVVFDDATDAYWFEQQIGAAVRQYAKLRSADISLYEFKAVGATPVPTFAVTLKSPAALAAPYTLTMPGALPVGSAPSPMTVDASGNIAAGLTVTLTIAPAGGYNILGTFAPDVNGGIVCSAAGSWYVPIPLHTGDRVKSVTIAGSGDGAVDAVLDLFYISSVGVATNKATANITNAPVPFADYTATAGAPAALAAGDVCLVKVTPNATGLNFNNYRIVYDRP